MKKRTLTSVAVVTVACFIFLGAATAYAKSPQRYRWEGVAIGLGAAILGSSILHHGYHHRPAPPPFYRHHPRPDYDRCQMRRVWVPPQYDWVWIPGHPGHGYYHAPGHWEKRLISPGYW